MITYRPIRRAGFTLVELLVVISIFVLLLALAVPAFSSMLYTSEQTLAESTLRVALGTARGVATASPTGQDAAAVFTYDPATRKTTILICTKAGTLQYEDGVTSNILTQEVFAAAPGVEPVGLPAGWTIRGYAAPSTIDDEWYGDDTYPNTGQIRANGHWLFPETGFYDDRQRDDGSNRQTFMVRFEGSTGLIKVSDPTTVLVLAPSESVIFRNGWPNVPIPGTLAVNPPWATDNNPWDVTQETDQLRFARRIIAWPTFAGNGQPTAMDAAGKGQILGMRCTDVVLTRPVGQLALCKESRLATAIGARIDPKTGTIYQAIDPNNNIVNPTFVQINGSPFGVTGIDMVDQWVEGRLVDPNGEPIDSDSRIFTLQRYLGWLQEVTGTKGGLGVGS